MQVEEVVIIGAGPAGITAAIQLTRCGVTTVLFERDQVGGLVRSANLVENYPGFPEGIKGVRLVTLFERQLKNVGVNVQQAEVLSLDHSRNTFKIITDRTCWYARHVIVASGTQPKRVAVKVAPEAHGKIYHEIWPLLDVRKKRIVVVGAGEAAFDGAMSLSRHNRVVILNRSGSSRCLPVLQDRVNACSHITYHTNTQITEIKKLEKNILEIIYMKDNHQKNRITCNFVVFAVGREPALSFLAESLKGKMQKFVKEGRLYFAGDVCNARFRQVAIAAGDGLRAAMKIYANMRSEA